jgi:hypothetical protein
MFNATAIRPEATICREPMCDQLGYPHFTDSGDPIIHAVSFGRVELTQVEGEPWELSLTATEDQYTVETARQLAADLASATALMADLNRAIR